jgi:tetratricopeptide (TPR) repeat protein
MPAGGFCASRHHSLKDRSAPVQPNPVQAKFQAGLALHKQGRLAEAAKIYEDVLAADKAHVAALHCLGGLAYQMGNLERAVTLIAQAVRINPRIAAADACRGAALNRLDRHDEALAVSDQTIRLKPDFAEAHYNRGNAFYGLGRYAEASASYDTAIALRPDFAEAWSNRGNALQKLGHADGALASCTRAVELKPNYAPGHCNRGNALYDLKRWQEALASYDKAIELNPNYAQAFYNRGKTLTDLKRLDEAIASYDRATLLKPDYAQAWCNRGNVLSDLEHFQQALASYDKAIALKPDYAEAWSNRGTALQYLYRLDEALACHDKALALNPDYAEAHCNRGSVLNSIKRPQDALASFDRAIAVNPDFAQAHFNKAITELGLGNMEDGWREFEWRRKIVEMAGNRTFPKPLLTSLDEVQGKTILVHFEHGFGDTIQFYRYLELLHRAGARILLNAQEKLERLLSLPGFPLTFVNLDDPTLAYDYHVPMMSLPLACRTIVQTIPAKVPYIFPDDDLVRKWRDRLGGDGFKIGICWTGSLTHLKGHQSRIFPVTCFEKVSKLPGVRLISLQKGDGEGDLKSLPPGMTVEGFDDLDAGPDAFVDTAAVMKCLDLVITNDTSISHLAGALGVPTFVALQYVADWRWMFDRADSPWYPTMRLFRQRVDGDWNNVFREIESTLDDVIGKPVK